MEPIMDHISRKDAAKAGFELFFTGKPCCRGHIGPRRVNGGDCIECACLRSAERREKYPEETKEAIARWKSVNKPKVAQHNRRDYEAHREARIAKSVAWAAANPERIAEKLRVYKESGKLAEYSRKWAAANPDKKKAKRKSDYEKNAERYQQQARAWREANVEQVKENKQSWKRANHGLVIAAVKLRKKHIKQRTPTWADLKAIAAIYANCPAGYHVDHIIPLRGKNVHGLHIETNLQYLPGPENLRKGNKFD
jgi:hypothetical protein